MHKHIAYLATLAAIISGVVPFSALASSPTMSSASWSYGDEITVSGGDLEGVYVRLKHLCFSPVMLPDKNTCFGHYDTENKVWDFESDVHIKRWDTSSIVFTVPADVPPQGVLKLFLTNEEQKCFGSAGCDMYPLQEEVTIGQFMTVPHVTDVVDATTGQSVTTVQQGGAYTIKGTLFGIDKGSVQYGEIVTTRIGDAFTSWHPLSALDIQSWDTNEIRFKPSATFALQGGIQVSNGANPSNIFIPTSSLSSTSPTSSSTSSRSSSTSSRASSSDRVERSSFKDVPDTDPYLAAIEWGKSSGILQGYPDGTFQPERTVNRAEFLKIVLGAKGISSYNGVGTNVFEDVDESAWYAPYVQAGRMLGIVQGYPDGTFKPNQTVNWAEALKMTYKALGVSTSNVGTEWFEPFLQHAKLNGLLFSTDFQIDGGVSRRDVVWIVWKIMTHHGEWLQPSAATMAPSLTRS